jgi:ParB family chromosome partitioning protein
MSNDVITVKIKRELIDDNPAHNCRGKITPTDVQFLIDDIAKNGLLQPIIVRPFKFEAFEYRIVAGFSRFMALRVLKWAEIPCVIRNCDEEESMFLNLTENLVRKNLNWMQEASAIKRILDRYPMCTEASLADRLGQSRGWVQVRKYALALPPEVQEEIAKGNVNYEQIRQIWQMPLRENQLKAIRKIKEARERGIRVKLIDKPPRDPNVKEPRTRADIFSLMDHIQQNLGNNFGTRCLSWAAGEISDLEIFHDMKNIADNEEKPYEIPKEPLPRERL